MHKTLKQKSEMQHNSEMVKRVKGLFLAQASKSLYYCATCKYFKNKQHVLHATRNQICHPMNNNMQLHVPVAAKCKMPLNVKTLLPKACLLTEVF